MKSWPAPGLSDHLDADCPDCPVWFDEGLATLYEKTASVGDRVQGVHNGRH